MRVAIFLVALVVLLAVGGVATVLGAAGCDENLHPGTTRTTVCTHTGLDSGSNVAALLYFLAPSLLFLVALTVIPAARRRLMPAALAIAALSVVGYAIVLALIV